MGELGWRAKSSQLTREAKPIKGEVNKLARVLLLLPTQYLKLVLSVLQDRSSG